MHMCAKMGASRSSNLFAVHNRTFREGRTYERINERPAGIHRSYTVMTL